MGCIGSIVTYVAHQESLHRYTPVQTVVYKKSDLLRRCSIHIQSHVPAVYMILGRVIHTDSTLPVLTSAPQEVQTSDSTLVFSSLHIYKALPT